jgi:hypothetical protein
MPQTDILQETGHSHTVAANSKMVYRTTNQGAPLTHQNVDDNFELLRGAVNQLIDDISTGDTTLQNNINSLSTTVTNNTNKIPTFSYNSVSKVLTITGVE